MNIAGLCRREWLALTRSRANIVNPLAFLFLAVTLFAVGGSTNPELRAQSAGAVLWVIVLLTNMLSLDGLFRRDYENGVLEQMMLSADPPFVPVLIRVLGQWLTTGFFITVLAPFLALLLAIPASALVGTTLALLLGTPALSLFGAIGASLTVGFSRGGVLLGLLILPLLVPVLIFGAGAVNNEVAGISSDAQLYWLLFISMVALTIGPFATTAGLKISLQLQ